MSRLKLPVVAHVFLIRGGTILLARRANTGFEDGNYGPVSGHLEPGETIMQAAVRECREEIGVELGADSPEVIGVTHYSLPTGDGLDFFFQVRRWTGEPTAIAECEDLLWCHPDSLPNNTIPFVRRALEHHLLAGVWFDELCQVSAAS
jgi:8-oxo-dGTP diphosphatase